MLVPHSLFHSGPWLLLRLVPRLRSFFDFWRGRFWGIPGWHSWIFSVDHIWSLGVCHLWGFVVHTMVDLIITRDGPIFVAILVGCYGDSWHLEGIDVGGWCKVGLIGLHKVDSALVLISDDVASSIVECEFDIMLVMFSHSCDLLFNRQCDGVF